MHRIAVALPVAMTTRGSINFTCRDDGNSPTLAGVEVERKHENTVQRDDQPASVHVSKWNPFGSMECLLALTIETCGYIAILYAN